MLSQSIRRIWNRLTSNQATSLHQRPVCPNSPATQVRQTAPRQATPTPAAPVYPPSDQGIAYIPIEFVIQSQNEMIKRLRLLAGTDDETFDRLYMSVIRNLAEHINQLPASETGTHNGPGGLFRLALEIGFYALQASEAVIFTGREGAETRRHIEPRWRYAAFLAGLCIELHRPTTSMIVVAPRGDEWPAFQVSLGSWLASQQTDRFFIRWQGINAAAGSSGQGAASYMVYKIIPEPCLQYIHEASNKIVPTMLDAIMGTVAPNSISPLFKILAEVRNKVMKRDEAIRPANYGRATVGTHLEPHLLDAMRRLLKDGTWKVNEKKARLWYGKDGLFLVWKPAAKEIIELLERDGVQGIPKDSQTLLDLLLKTNVFMLDSDGSPYWTILPPGGANDLIAIRFENPLTLFGESFEEPSPVESLQRRSPQSEVTAPLPIAPLVSEATTPATKTEEIATAESNSVKSSADCIDKVTGEISVATPNPAKATKTPKREKPQVSAPQKSVSPVDAVETMGLPKDLQALFKPLTREVLGCLLEDHLAGETKGETGKVSDGFAITVERLGDYGADPMAVIEELETAGWLYKPLEKPKKKIHQVKMNNKDCHVVILLTSAATDAGFIT